MISTLQAGQDDKDTQLQFQLLHSPTFDAEVTRRVLNNMCYCMQVSEKLAALEIVKNGFKKPYSIGCNIEGNSSVVLLQ